MPVRRGPNATVKPAGLCSNALSRRFYPMSFSFYKNLILDVVAISRIEIPLNRGELANSLLIASKIEYGMALGLCFFPLFEQRVDV